MTVTITIIVTVIVIILLIVVETIIIMFQFVDGSMHCNAGIHVPPPQADLWQSAPDARHSSQPHANLIPHVLAPF